MTIKNRWLLLRHARTQGCASCFVGRSDRAIAPVPDEAASRLVEALKNVDAVVLTPLRRTRQTLDLLVRHGLAVPAQLLVEPALVEQDFGRWEERGYDALAAEDPAYWPFWDDPVEKAPPDGESFRAVSERSRAACERLAARLQGQVLHIGHAGPIRTLLGGDLRAALARDLPPLSLHRVPGGPI